MHTPAPFAQLYPGDRVRLPEGADGWGPERLVVDVRHGITPDRLPITTVWWQAPYYQPDCQAFTGVDYARGFLRLAPPTEPTDAAAEAPRTGADGRVA